MPPPRSSTPPRPAHLGSSRQKPPFSGEKYMGREFTEKPERERGKVWLRSQRRGFLG